MEFSVPLWLLAAVGILIVLAIGFAIPRMRPEQIGVPQAAPIVKSAAPGLALTLNQLQQSGQWSELLRLLDRTLPEWTVSSSLIEVARALSGLDRELAAVPAGPVTDVVTSRLAEQNREVSDDLWQLAARIDLTARRGDSRSRQMLEEDDNALVRLLAAIQETRAEVADLALGPTDSNALERAEGRFKSLAATARELREFDSYSEIR